VGEYGTTGRRKQFERLSIEMVSERTDKWAISSDAEKAFEWRKWCEQIPDVKFPKDWNVQLMPPFAGAIVRFVAKKKNKRVSVYLDCYDMLGCFGEPHWEAYPIKDNNVRWPMADWKKMFTAINRELNKPDEY
jgi:hypothetical protein